VKTLLVGLSRSVSRASDVRRAVATHGETEGCEGSLETGCSEQRGLSAWMMTRKKYLQNHEYSKGELIRVTQILGWVILFVLQPQEF
jgi:hypothetical protein